MSSGDEGTLGKVSRPRNGDDHHQDRKVSQSVTRPVLPSFWRLASEFYIVQKRRLTDIEALKLRKGSGGRAVSQFGNSISVLL